MSATVIILEEISTDAKPTTTSTGPVIVRHVVPDQLRGLVAGIIGFDETAPVQGRVRVQPAGSLLVLEVSFATPLRIRLLDSPAESESVHDAFLAGMMPVPVRTVFFGRHASVQVYLTPIGAFRLLGVPGTQTVRRVLSLLDLMPRLGRDLPDRLAEARNWDRRFAVVEHELLLLAAHGRESNIAAQWVWAQLQHTGGQARMMDLARHSGWSARHIGKVFHEVTGMSPKAAAQVVRFERIHADLGRWDLAELAQRHGLADQSHLSREVRRYAGESPLALAREQRPTAFTALLGCDESTRNSRGAVSELNR